jgi:hypothetical protein
MGVRESLNSTKSQTLKTLKLVSTSPVVKYFILFLVSLIGGLFGLTFSPLYVEPFNPDVSFYMSVGEGWWEGLVPYRDIFNTKRTNTLYFLGWYEK